MLPNLHNVIQVVKTDSKALPFTSMQSKQSSQVWNDCNIIMYELIRALNRDQELEKEKRFKYQ